MSARREMFYAIVELGCLISGVVFVFCGDWELAACAFMCEAWAWSTEVRELRRLVHRSRPAKGGGER